MKDTLAPKTAFGFLPLDSETGRLIAIIDWSSTPIGPPDQWPQSLRTATTMLLRSPVPIVMLWGDDGFMLYNDAYSEFAGQRHPRLLGSKVREGWPEVADFNDNVMRVGLAGGTLSYQDQELTLYRNGMAEQVWMNLDYSPVLDESGNPAGVICILRETTERVTKERRLNAERDRLWNLSQDMLARADYSGMMTAVSPAWTSVLGWSEEELLTRPYASFMHPDDMPPTIEAIQRMGQFDEPTRFENRIAAKNGAWKPIEWTVTPEPGGAQFIAVGRDLSLNKARDAELQKAQEELRQAQKMDMIGQLTGGVAHDFNNLLMAVIANLDLLKRHAASDPRMARLIDGAIQGANRGASLTQRLLAFARRQDLALVPRDISDLVSGLSDLLTKSVGPQIELRYDLQADLAPALVDANQVELALLNLVVNGRDALPEGGTITIRTSQLAVVGDEQLPDGKYLVLTVTDNGIGMSEETLAKATDPFFSTKELGKGTGLGLSMIHGLAIQLKGALRLSSRVGEGTTAEFLVPATDMGAPASAPLEDSAPRTVGARRTILIVDDDALIAMSTVDLIEDLGHVVIEANSGREALEHIYSSQHIDLMITDFAMPQMNGGQLATAARIARPNLPILLATGFADLPPGAEIGLPRLSKPYTQQQLEREIAKLLG
ncbi:PAS domain S-box protein [Bosea sp. UC22_33]|uniref:hybrid sensor histidine kinase/response regulator n=1 Tax=Bosea sp. UC22_33 TaxID=3350165 RepID=UPI00366D9965